MPVIVVDDRLRHGPEERERMDVAIDPYLQHGRRVGPYIAAVAMRQIQYEEVRLDPIRKWYSCIALRRFGTLPSSDNGGCSAIESE
jgi:hypothetical protein